MKWWINAVIKPSPKNSNNGSQSVYSHSVWLTCIARLDGFDVGPALTSVSAPGAPPQQHAEALFYGHWSVVYPFSVNTYLHDKISVYLKNVFLWNLPQIFFMWVGIAQKVFWVKGQGHFIIIHKLYCYSSYSYSPEGAVHCVQCMNAIMVEVCISPVWYSGSIEWLIDWLTDWLTDWFLAWLVVWCVDQWLWLTCRRI